MAVLVTGGAGFIGSNLVHALAGLGREVIVVDDLAEPKKRANLAGLNVDVVEPTTFRKSLQGRGLVGVTTVVHQAASTRTDEVDRELVKDLNVQYPREVLQACLASSVPLVYASSASVYGRNCVFREDARWEHPLNEYGWSKLIFDQEVRSLAGSAHVVGLRYFNVYGPREDHKADMASVIAQLDRAVRDGRPATLFAASHGVPDGGHRRDFVHVNDVVATVLWFIDHPIGRAILNCGSGQDRSFGELGRLVLDHHGGGELSYVPMPERFLARYQVLTRADLGALRAAGCPVTFRPIERGVPEYLRWRDRATSPTP